jgi:hypothetical protein
MQWFNPQQATADIATTLRSYGIYEVVGDRYAASWTTAAFAGVGMTYRHSEDDRSTIYSNALPLFSAGRVRLIDSKRLINQLAALERRTSPIGRDRIDHPDRGHDDSANAVCGSLALAAAYDGFSIDAYIRAWS